ncbi:MAG: VOC family protein [Alphaproteobacteria bacterium]|nr:VOC family protein [Alphaproteobacteria bacterium]
MIDHVSIPVSNIKLSASFYERVLAPLGYLRIADRESMVGFGKKFPEFWLNARPDMVPVPAGTGCHICLRTRSKEAVSAFYKAALTHGGRGDGEPGERQGEMTSYYGAFILDPDGNKIEAAAFPAAN